MVGDGNGYSTLRDFLLHYNVATAATNFFKTRFSQNSADLFAGWTRNLTNRYLHLGDENLFMEALLDFFRRSGLEKKFKGFTQIIASGFDSVALACDVQFGAQGDISIALTLDQGSQFH
jgi:hypothetical protein